MGNVTGNSQVSPLVDSLVSDGGAKIYSYVVMSGGNGAGKLEVYTLVESLVTYGGD